MCWRWSAGEMPKSLGSLHASRFPMMMDSSFMVPKPAATPAKPKVPVSNVTSGMVSSQRVLRTPANEFGTSRRGNGDWLWSPKLHYNAARRELHRAALFPRTRTVYGTRSRALRKPKELVVAPGYEEK